MDLDLIQGLVKFDFFFLHVKRMDSAGEDGDFDRKVALIEEVDARCLGSWTWSLMCSSSPAIIPHRRC